MTAVKAIIRRYHCALENVVDARIACENLTSAAPAHCIIGWESEIEMMKQITSTIESIRDGCHAFQD